MATSAAKDLLALAREHPEEAVLCRPEYAEGFAAVTTVLLELGGMQEAAGQVRSWLAVDLCGCDFG